MANKSNFIPEGFHTATPYLIVKDGARAIDFCKKAFGAIETEHLTDSSGRVVHAEFRIGDSMIMLGEHQNIPAPSQGLLPQVSIYLYVEDVDAVAKRAIAAGAKEKSPVKDQYYGNREGGVEDPVGITWWIATAKEKLSSEELQKRHEAARR